MRVNVSKNIARESKFHQFECWTNIFMDMIAAKINFHLYQNGKFVIRQIANIRYLMVYIIGFIELRLGEK